VFTLDQLLAATSGRVIQGTPRRDDRFRGGAFDSRIVQPGEVFFALRDQRDGHEFVGDAFARGALAAVVERAVPAPDDALLIEVSHPLHALRRLAEALRDAHPIPAVGITGSVGKTTAKEAVAAALGARYRVLRTAASFNNEIGVPLTFLRLEPTHEVAVIELGFYVPGEIADLCQLVRPRIGIITEIPAIPVHFARTPNVEAIAKGKAELIESLPDDGVALLNADSPRVRALAPRTQARVILFGESEDAALRAVDVRADGLAGLRFTAVYEGERVAVALPIPGRQLVPAALSALGAAHALGVPLAEAAVALGALEQPAHRMEIRRGPGVTVIDDSYNASPVAVQAALAVLRDVKGRRIAVLGDMLELGSFAAEAHDALGRDAARSTDVLIGIGELMRAAVDAARAAGLAEAYWASELGEALVVLRRLQRPGDTILVKGSHSLGLDRLADTLVRPVAD
jgi:UDP-N-acetylmuramoyl-tripeptide--D-alanyl-D-alanine ligase